MSHPSPAELERTAEFLMQQSRSLSVQNKHGQAGQKLREATRLRVQAADLKAKGYPFAPAYGKRATSHEAAAKLAKKVGKYHLMVLDDLKHRDLTNSEIIARHPDVNPRTIQPRTGELMIMGRVFDTGRKRKNQFGNSEIVWSLTDPKAQRKIA